MQRRAAKVSPLLELDIGIGHVHVSSQNLDTSLDEEIASGLLPGETPDVDGPDVEGRLVRENPLCERLTHAAAVREPRRVEAGADVEAAQVRKLAHERVPVRGKALGPVDEMLDADRLEQRKPAQALVERGREVLPVGLEQAEGEVVGHAVDDPRLAHPLEGAEHERLALSAEVDAPIGIANDRQASDVASDRVREHVVVLDGLERNRVSGDLGQLPGPHAGAEHDGVGVDGAAHRSYAGHPSISLEQVGDANAFLDGGAMPPGGLGDRLHQL